MTLFVFNPNIYDNFFKIWCSFAKNGVLRTSHKFVWYLIHNIFIIWTLFFLGSFFLLYSRTQSKRSNINMSILFGFLLQEVKKAENKKFDQISPNFSLSFIYPPKHLNQLSLSPSWAPISALNVWEKEEKRQGKLQKKLWWIYNSNDPLFI